MNCLLISTVYIIFCTGYRVLAAVVGLTFSAIRCRACTRRTKNCCKCCPSGVAASSRLGRKAGVSAPQTAAAAAAALGPATPNPAADPADALCRQPITHCRLC